MSDYPTAIADFRTKSNIPGQVYDVAKQTTVYVEDLTALEAEVIAIEEVIGTDPLDGYADLDERIGSKQNSLGFTPENAANKQTDLTPSATKYPTVNAVNNGLDGKQPLDSDLTVIAGLTPTTDSVMQSKAGAWSSRTLAQLAADLKVEIGKGTYPVGVIFSSTVSTNPATLLGFGTWVATGVGRVLVGKASSGTFGTAGATGGAETHTLTVAEIPSHYHSMTQGSAAIGSGNYTAPQPNTVYPDNSITNATGGGGSHNNLAPYLVVYLWERTV